MTRPSALIALVLLASVSVSAIGCKKPAPAGQAADVQVKYKGAQASAELAKVFTDSDETELKMSPLGAMFRGDMRYSDQFGDYITDGYIAAQRTASETDLRRLHEIDRSSLTPEEQVAYDVFDYQTKQALQFLSPEIIALTGPRPLDHMNGLHIQFPDMSSGGSAAQFKTVKDYDDGLKRMDGYVVYLDRAIGRMREGMKTGVVQPRLVVDHLIVQLEDLIAQGVDKSPFWAPVAKMPADVPAADNARIETAYRAELNDKIVPAYRRLRNFLAQEYLPKSRDTVGLYGMPSGAKLYALLVEQQTTTKMTPEQIHALGLSEVARIRGEMENVKAEVGFKGDLSAFFKYLRDKPDLKPKSSDELRRDFESIAHRVNAAIPHAFSLVPKTKLEIRPVPTFLEKSQPGGYYNQGTPDSSRPGVFYYNTYDLPSRSILTNETLFLHEGVPGHHFQVSLAQENDKLPKFLRFGSFNAFAEGWALYAESLGPELGMFKDPYQRFGHYQDEMLRAMRLVVDTGLHGNGWSRDQAVNYMLDNSPMSRARAVSEVDRYIAMPGQALGYKIGALTIRRLRTKAESKLGSKFDVRAFHAQVLNTGALPLEVLEAKIDRWIAAEKEGGVSTKSPIRRSAIPE